MKVFSFNYYLFPPLSAPDCFKKLGLSFRIWLLVMLGYLTSMFLTDLVWGVYCALVFDLLGSNPNFQPRNPISPQPGNCSAKLP
ncbi:protein E33A [Elephant endotheliotropic herpesvirus 3A]|uniref:Protein E33A n=1 Tax=Elephant endotheliotropic herpesvirus 3A TaxID=1329409 RepID=A0A866VSL9_9BETA|nr:protein E33A [Elephant endotheliotropic herpesvirus 3A]QOE74409.1 protein E33A [Elephant endotheliotropic herpesvirus 3A]